MFAKSALSSLNRLGVAKILKKTSPPKAMKTKILAIDDLRRIVTTVGIDKLMDELIERLKDAFLQYDPARVSVPTREGFFYSQPVPGLIEWMPLRECDQVTIKIVGYHPSNPTRAGMPTILSTISAYDTHTGHLICVADGTLLTAMRTGAASAVASDVLAREDSRRLGLIGCGVQALTQFHALSRNFDFEEVLIYDREPAVADGFAGRMQRLEGAEGLVVRKVAVAEMVSQVDILCTATTVEAGAGPVFEDGNVRPWLHVNAVGSDLPGKMEVPRSLLKRSLVCPDFAHQALREGECQQLESDAIGPELAVVLKEAERFEELREKTTVFDSTGFALEDHVALGLACDYAKELGLGKEIELESLPTDPHDPYSCLVSTASAHIAA